MPNVILRNILLQLGEIEVKGRNNIKTMNNAMDNIDKLIQAVEKAMEQEKELEKELKKKGGTSNADCNKQREDV